MLWATTVCDLPSEYLLNDDTDNELASWFDHPRDLLHLVNVKRAEMPRPIVGVGHSMGGAHLSVPLQATESNPLPVPNLVPAYN